MRDRSFPVIRRLAVLILVSGAPAAAEGISEIVPATPQSPEFVMAERVAESLALPPPMAISTADLDNDGFPELLAFGEGGVRILRLGKDAWSDISGGRFSGATGLEAIALTGRRFNGYPVLRWSDADYAFSRGAYAPLAAIAPTPLDASVFAPACEKADAIVFDLEENGAGAGEAPAFCSCLIDQWQARDAGQAVFDTYARELAGTFRSEDRDEREEADRLFATIDEALFDCKRERGFPAEPPASFGAPLFAGKAGPKGLAATIDICRAQDWVLSNRAIGSPGRALGYCGCLAGSLAQGGMTEAGFRLVGGLYSGELSENDVREEDPSAVGASDEASEICVGLLPWR